MKSICYLFGYLLALSVTTIAGQNLQACFDAQSALANSQQCSAANTQVNLLLSNSGAVVDREVLNTYCSQTCRDIFLRIRVNCDDQVSLNSLHMLDTYYLQARISVGIVKQFIINYCVYISGLLY